MESYLKQSLEEWKEEIVQYLNEVNEEYEKVKRELHIYSFKYGITNQVIQSTSNEEITKVIKQSYHKPFEERYTQLKEEIKDLEEQRKVFQMFVDKIEKVSLREEIKTINY
ncbi:phosphopantetheine adenylyltransferase [Bacillus mesophilus]|uniref:Uncharacterized protein n=1 Tax=Bacillus mesophilus TaxID=1808955 RepID=A0A6M0Q7H9_9BACI|nr:hypothetical protein [Bacillus mesophilus]MBM7660744.1 phosphopantetheine adenylyltransferase [Bacillus mesophilus]NEY71709.1 hypothetical protein [Bacillus mesophilus]